MEVLMCPVNAWKCGPEEIGECAWSDKAQMPLVGYYHED